MLNDDDEEASRKLTDNRVAVYRELLRKRIDSDALHELIGRYGLALLDRDVPYLMVAARNRAIDRQRREGRSVELDPQADQPGLVLDPASVVDHTSELHRAILALGELDQRDAWALWWNAAGFSDAEIAEKWTRAGFTPPHPSNAYLRQRRRRARLRLKDSRDRE